MVSELPEDIHDTIVFIALGNLNGQLVLMLSEKFSQLIFCGLFCEAEEFTFFCNDYQLSTAPVGQNVAYFLQWSGVRHVLG